MAKKKGAKRQPPNRGAASSSSRSSGSSGSSRPLSRTPQQAPSGPASDARRTLERRSAGPLLMLHRLPKWVIPILMVALLLLGLLIPSNWAGIFIVLIAVFLGWLLALSWPVILPGSRLFRLLVIVLVAGVGIAKMLGLT